MIELGVEVRDIVTGFSGTTIARTEWLNGCARLTVQPKIGKDGKLPDNATFDEPQLSVVSKKKVKRGNKKTGGPLPFSPVQNATPKR